jgi:outer membrane receptor for ferric coprogen and ferric-rhodotorulic acid
MTRLSLRLPAAFAAFSACAALVPAQTVAPAATPAAVDPIVLSPFVVDTSGDRGYFASSTLAASRLKTDLKDIASSVSVLTEEFMNDLAANDVATALAFVSGAENDSTYHQESVAALGGANGYVGGDFGDNNNRSGEVRVRGLGRASTTINYIEVLGSTDRYNTDRTEFLRGANSILFGLAEPAGLVNSSTKVAQLRRNFAKLETKFDDFGSARFVLDINRTLLPGKLAVRGVVLDNDQQFRVKSAYQKDQRYFGTITYQPFKHTTLRGYVERVNANGRRPNFRTVQDNVSEWLTAYNRYAPQMTPAQIAQAFYWDPAAPSANGIAPNSIFTLANGSTVNLGLIRRPLDTLATATALIYSGNGQWNTPLDNLVTITSNRTVTGGAVNPVSARSQFARTGSARENSALFSADPQVTDESIFPYRTVEIGALPGNYRWEDDDKIFLTLDQRLAEDLYLSASFQYEKRTHEQYFATLTQTNQISVDINQRLPDGRTNPNFLRPFIYGRNLGEYSDAKARTVVVQANYDFDFARKAPRFGWLGSHRLTSVYNAAKVDRLGYRWHYMVDNNIPVALTAANIGAAASQRWAMQMWYVGDPVQVGDQALRFTGFPSNLATHWDRSYDYRFFNNTATPAPGQWQTASTPAHFGRQLIAGGRTFTIQKNDGVGVSLQSFFWKRRIVTLLGWRDDRVDSTQGVLRPASEFPFPITAGANRSDYLPGGSKFENQATTGTQGLVFKVTEQLRVFANRSENFAATTPRQDNLYRPLPPQSGETKDYGIGLTLLDGRLDVRATAFKSSQLGATSATGVAGIRIVAFEEGLYRALSNAGRSAEYVTIDEFGRETNAVYVRPNNAASTENLVSKGESLEISFRPNRHWDLIGGVDRLENVATNVGREVAEFLAVRAPFYKKYFDEGLRADGTTTTASSMRLVDQFANTIAGNYVNEILKEGISNRGVSEYTARLVGRYKFLEGAFKGLTIGTNLRWESGKVLGYAQKDTTFDFGGLSNYPGRVSDTSKEHRGDAALSGGMFLSYGRRIFGGKVGWRVQLNAQNLFGEQGLRVFAANPDGSPIWAMAPARVFELSNSFEF